MMNFNVALLYHCSLSFRGRAREGEQAWQLPQSVNIYSLPGVARRLVTFFVLPKKVTQKSRPQSAIPAGFPVLLEWTGGCGTRTACSDSPRRHPLSILRYSVADKVKEMREQRMVINTGYLSEVRGALA